MVYHTIFQYQPVYVVLFRRLVFVHLPLCGGATFLLCIQRTVAQWIFVVAAPLRRCRIDRHEDNDKGLSMIILGVPSPKRTMFGSSWRKVQDLVRKGTRRPNKNKINDIPFRSLLLWYPTKSLPRISREAPGQNVVHFAQSPQSMLKYFRLINSAVLA